MVMGYVTPLGLRPGHMLVISLSCVAEKPPSRLGEMETGTLPLRQDASFQMHLADHSILFSSKVCWEAESKVTSPQEVDAICQCFAAVSWQNP